MRNLLQFLARYHVLLLFVVLQLIALSLTVQSQSFQRSTFFSGANAVSGSVLGSYHQVENFINLRETNRNLARENAELRSTLKSSYFPMYVERDTIVDTLYNQEYKYINAMVINSSFNKRNNYMTLNRGSAHGIKTGQGVISADGAVGIIKDVSAHYATVIPLIHSNTRLSGKFKKSNYFGSANWSGGDHRVIRLSDIPRQASFVVGDTVVTDTRSGIFPAGIIIGTVRDYDIEPQDQLYEVDLTLAVDFAKVEHVYVIEDLFKEERRALEERSQNDR